MLLSAEPFFLFEVAPAHALSLSLTSAACISLSLAERCHGAHVGRPQRPRRRRRGAGRGGRGQKRHGQGKPHSNMRRVGLISNGFLCTPLSPHLPFNFASSFHTCILCLSLFISLCMCRSCRFSQAGNTSLHLAAADGHTATAQVLVEAGANLHATDAVR